MIYYEDMVPGEGERGPSTTIDRDEMVAFARTWDPVPFHVDEAAGIAAFGSLTAPGLYMLAVKQRLIHQRAEPHAVIASTGYDEVRFHEPLRPGDTVRLDIEYVSRRPSKSRADRGIVTLRFRLVNQHEVVVMSHLDTILVRMRAPAPQAG